MSNASESDDISFTVDEWAAILDQAGARKPWADQDAAQQFAAGITFRWPEFRKRERGTFNRASEAISELRRVLPGIIAEHERFLTALNNPPSKFRRSKIAMARVQTEHDLAALRRLLGALPEFRWELRKPRTQPWKLDAARLYTLYLRHIDPDAGISADGPPVRFIVLALKRMRLRNVEHDAIAKTLQRLRKDQRSRKLDKSNVE